ncbi:SET domain-containing protein 5 [Puccinia graminis f. sp. tritici]|uniref:SET domain-containing protein 5 n=1 Tax=Puccinia graminis f. sp. tritici TaxID=56615 RepID=A0A5B0Q8P2_PUCGR|nr:SET domain-containing protein 5 [Puccinia graminis f. sp. tritici]KAA1109527.1 SET domain-containing protein 5 [Puccinia graminis f. sp. tritici]KAA1132992.1 SET domain-containing protein 5 [Puccinia graminis f. sp. tritici]
MTSASKASSNSSAKPPSIARLIMPLHSRFTHSCDPNAVVLKHPGYEDIHKSAPSTIYVMARKESRTNKRRQSHSRKRPLPGTRRS